MYPGRRAVGVRALVDKLVEGQPAVAGQQPQPPRILGRTPSNVGRLALTMLRPGNAAYGGVYRDTTITAVNEDGRPEKQPKRVEDSPDEFFQVSDHPPGRVIADAEPVCCRAREQFRNCEVLKHDVVGNRPPMSRRKVKQS